MVIFHSYVSLPEGRMWIKWTLILERGNSWTPTWWFQQHWNSTGCWCGGPHQQAPWAILRPVAWMVRILHGPWWFHGFTVSLKALIHTGKKPSTRVAATIEIAAGCRILWLFADDQIIWPRPNLPKFDLDTSKWIMIISKILLVGGFGFNPSVGVTIFPIYGKS